MKMTSKRLDEIAAEIDAEVAAEMAAQKAATREQRHARDMSPEEYKTKLAALRRDPSPKPMPPLSESASQEERAQWLREARRRH
jgi:hypothetical protein